MARFVGYEECPRCVEQGRDRAGDNLGRYDDGGGHCFSCGHHVFPNRVVRRDAVNEPQNQITLPRDFTRDVPAMAWKWLLQYGLPYTYWKPFTGYSPAEERLVFTVGEPIRFSIGRYLGEDVGERGTGQSWVRRAPRKWWFYGDGHGHVEVLEPKERCTSKVVLVEDVISAHKVGQVATAICLFGTNVHAKAISALQYLEQPVTLWLDYDQRTLLPKKINRLNAFLRHPVDFIVTEKDPKAYSLDELKEILNE